MATEMIPARRHQRIGAVLAMLALAVALVVLTIQANSIRSTTIRHGDPVRVHGDPNANIVPVPAGHIPDGCRVKLGCERSLDKIRHIPIGCRVKFGCPDGRNNSNRQA